MYVIGIKNTAPMSSVFIISMISFTYDEVMPESIPEIQGYKKRGHLILFFFKLGTTIEISA
jgi:hypothetical protein